MLFDVGEGGAIWKGLCACRVALVFSFSTARALPAFLADGERADASERPTEASGAQNGEIAKRTTTARRVDGRARYDCKQLPIAHYAGSPL